MPTLEKTKEFFPKKAKPINKNEIFFEAYPWNKNEMFLPEKAEPCDKNEILLSKIAIP